MSVNWFEVAAVSYAFAAGTCWGLAVAWDKMWLTIVPATAAPICGLLLSLSH